MLDRRTVLKHLGISAAGLLLAPRVLADPYDPVMPWRQPFAPVRVRGRVTVAGAGRGGVAVSDGISVAATATDGTYELLSSTHRSQVFMSLPGDAAIPRNPTGTARFYRALEPDARREMSCDFALDRREGGEKHAFLLMADPQTQIQDEVDEMHAETVPDVRGVARELADREPFAVACGDIMYDNLELYPGYERAVAAMGLPAFQVVGNHDVDVLARTDAASVTTFARHFGPTYYSFDRGEVHYVVLDDIFWFGGYIGYLDQVQLDWLRSDLVLVEPGRTVVVFVHIPVYTEYDLRRGDEKPSRGHVITNRELLYRLLEPYRAHVICGHMHQSEYLRDGGCDIHVVGAVCGAWWTGPICDDGTPRGYGVYEVDGPELKWRYKSVGRSFDHQMRLHAPGTDPAQPGRLLANVWSADRDWKVVWYQDGERKGAMEKRRGMDPLAVELYQGDEKPAKHTWVVPQNTDHIFVATPDAGAREVVVEATDRWGRVYSERMVL